MAKKLQQLAKKIGKWRRAKGFITPDLTVPIWMDGPEDSAFEWPSNDLMLGKLMLVTTEVAEAAEALRQGDYENFEEELADTVIRILDICDACHIDLDAAIEEKTSYNEERPTRHGKATLL